ncbi:MAG: carboxypeptidase-like regulatory domain-containing protein [Acidobacteria bacterium]|nr:carboxypeptidase-like regulatory domain-containing protein [Acidobacteriota bacterium]
MVRSRLRRILIGFVLGSLVCLGAPSRATDGRSWVRGTVSDPGGRRLAEVAVQISLLPAQSTAITTTTNARGEFFLPGLVPGLYLLTASKDGYGFATSRLNTLIDRSVSLVMPPVLGGMLPEDASVPRPDDSGWALRLPRRDLLRETGVEAVLSDNGPNAARPATPDRTPERNGTGARVDGSVDQRFAFVSSAGEAQGHTTQVDLGVDLGSDFRITLSGLSGGARLDSSDKGESLHKEHENHFARLVAEYHPRPNDRIELSALLSSRDYTVVPTTGAPADGFDQDLKGYGARWEHNLGGRGSMNVAVDYRAVEVFSKASEAADPDSGHIQPSIRSANNELWQAFGTLQLRLNDQRRMIVNMRARRLNVATPGNLAMSAFSPLGSTPGNGRERWAFDLHGREERVLNGPLSLDYGFRYHRRTQRVFSEASTDAFIPEAGVTISQRDGTRWSAGISLALDTPEALFAETGQATPGLEEDGLLSRVGYRFGVRHPFQRKSLTLAVNAVYHPFAYAPLDRDTPEPNLAGPVLRPFLVSEGNAESMRIGIELEKRFHGFVAAVGSQVGQVEGYMASGYFDETPVQELTYNLVQYIVASARGYRPGSGTLVHLDYQRYLSNPTDGLDMTGQSYELERIDFGLQQDLPSIALWNAHWRLLVIYRTQRTDAETQSDIATLRRAGILPSENRLSGGVAVRF